MIEEETEKPQLLIVDDSRVIRHAAIEMLSDYYLVHDGAS
jgi:CheY-like chemotaxis protein